MFLLNIFFLLGFIFSCQRIEKSTLVQNEGKFFSSNEFDVLFFEKGFKHKSYIFYVDNFKNYVVSGSADNSISIWDINKSSVVTNIKFSYRGSWGIPVKYTKDGKFLVVGAYEELQILDSSNYRVISKKNTHIKGIQTVSVSLDNKFVLTGGADGYVRVWTLPDLKLIKEKQLTKGEVWNANISYNDSYALAGTSDKFVFLFSIPELTIKKVITNDYPVEFVSFSPDGNFFLLADNFGNVIVYEFSNLESYYLKFREHISEVLVAKFVDNNFLISGGRDGDIYIYELAKKSVIKKYNIGSAVFYFEKSNIYKMLIFGTGKGEVLFYKIISKE